MRQLPVATPRAHATDGAGSIMFKDLSGAASGALSMDCPSAWPVDRSSLPRAAFRAFAAYPRSLRSLRYSTTRHCAPLPLIFDPLARQANKNS